MTLFSHQTAEKLKCFSTQLEIVSKSTLVANDKLFNNFAMDFGMNYFLENLSGEQIDAGKLLVSSFETVFWCVLLAQMQSGKTGAYLFVAAEMLRMKKIKKVIILCGCGDTELKEQMNDSIHEFERKYRTYLMVEHSHLPERERSRIVAEIFKKDTIVVKTGDELAAKHSSAEPTNTLFIWDESHYAAGKNNRPNKFLDRLGIRADGSSICLAPNNNFVLSVSATPYAELIDLHGEAQEKLVVKLIPGKEYKGVGCYLANKKIVGFAEWRTKLVEILSEQFAGAENKYGVVRVQGDVNMKDVISIVNECGWAHKVYDADKPADKTHVLKSMNELEHAPSKNTVIIIRGRCRMGKVVPKEHIAFVMETASASKTDTLLQGLLGRVCGYGIDSDIYIYIHNELLTKKTGLTGEFVSICGQTIRIGKTTELEKYVALMGGVSKEFSSTVSYPLAVTTKAAEVMASVDVSLIPAKAAHLKSQTQNPIFDMHPFVCKIDYDSADPDSGETLNEKIRKFDLTKCVENNNDELHTVEASLQLANPKTIIQRHYITDLDKKSFIEVPKTFRKILTTKANLNAVRSMASCGLAHDETTKMNAWVFNTNKYASIGFPQGTIILQALSDVPASGVYMQTTTGNEAFTSKREDKTVSVSNGTFVGVGLSAETSKSVEKMQTELGFIINLSLEIRTDEEKRRITSIHTPGGFQSIMVSDEVNTGLSKGGVIFKHIRETHGVTLKLKRRRGPVTSACKKSKLNLLCEISW